MIGQSRELERRNLELGAMLLRCSTTRSVMGTTVNWLAVKINHLVAIKSGKCANGARGQL